MSEKSAQAIGIAVKFAFPFSYAEVIVIDFHVISRRENAVLIAPIKQSAFFMPRHIGPSNLLSCIAKP